MSKRAHQINILLVFGIALGCLFLFIGRPRYGLMGPDLATLAVQCHEVDGTGSASAHFECSNGTEFKIVEKTSNEPAAAKIRLRGAFDTNEFSAAYIVPGKILKIDGEFSNGKNPTIPSQTIYAFMQEGKVAWISLARTATEYGVVTTVTDNLGGAVKSQVVTGNFDLPLPRDMQVESRRVTMLGVNQVYERLGL